MRLIRYEIICSPESLRGRFVTLQKKGTATVQAWEVVEIQVFR